VQLLIAHRDAAVRAALARAITGGAGSDDADEDLEVLERDEGTEALALLLQEHAPRLAVVEWDLPGLDAPELCRIVRDFHLGGPPYIVLLASTRHHDVEEGLLAGANDCIRTPARAGEIRERVLAGKRFVDVPWEHATRVVRDDPEGVITLDAVRMPDDDSLAWSDLEHGSAGATSGATACGKADLQAVLGEL